MQVLEVGAIWRIWEAAEVWRIERGALVTSEMEVKRSSAVINVDGMGFVRGIVCGIL